MVRKTPTGCHGIFSMKSGVGAGYRPNCILSMQQPSLLTASPDAFVTSTSWWTWNWAGTSALQRSSEFARWIRRHRHCLLPTQWFLLQQGDPRFALQCRSTLAGSRQKAHELPALSFPASVSEDRLSSFPCFQFCSQADEARPERRYFGLCHMTKNDTPAPS